MAEEKAQKELDDFNEAVAYVEDVTGETYPGDLWEFLKDGIVLCKMVNTLRAGIIPKVNKPGMAFKEMENLTMYNKACKSLGVGNNTFRPPDLYEKRSSYPKAIVLNILAVKRTQDGGTGSSSRSSPARTAPSSARATTSTRTNTTTTSTRTSSPAPTPTPSRTAATSEAHAIGSYDESAETERRRARAAQSSAVAGQPDWVKAAKSEQEQNDMIAAKVWMEAVVGEPFVNDDLWETTKSGVYLCKLINKVKAGTVKKYGKISSNLPFKCMENIGFYIEGCKSLGMRSGNTFRPPDLYEKRVSYPKAIINNIHALARLADDIKGYTGPHLEVEIAQGNKY